MARLSERLKALREAARLTQPQIARALKVSVPLISSWEHGTVPPRARLDAYARLFAREPPPDGRLRVPADDDLTPAERRTFHTLRAELFALHGTTGDDAASPLQFGPGDPITVVCTELPGRLRADLGYSAESDPDFVASYKYADLDALIELLPFVAARNPAARITVGVVRELTRDDLSAHLITLGGVDFNEMTAAMMGEFADVPVRQLTRPTDEDTGGFAVEIPDGTREHKPRLDGTTLREDVGHLLRAPNPYNRERTLTVFTGSYSRGTYGVVRALTSPTNQERNAAYIADRFRGTHIYSILSRVKIVANEVVVPDWTDDGMRLHEWPEARV